MKPAAYINTGVWGTKLKFYTHIKHCNCSGILKFPGIAESVQENWEIWIDFKDFSMSKKNPGVFQDFQEF